MLGFAEGLGFGFVAAAAGAIWLTRRSERQRRRRRVRQARRVKQARRSGYLEGYRDGFDRCWQLIFAPAEDEDPGADDPATRALEEHYRIYGDGPD